MYIREGFDDDRGLDALDRLSEIDIYNRRRRLLDNSAINAGDEKYLDDIYRVDGNNITNGDDGKPYNDEPRSQRHNSVPYTSAVPGSGRGAMINPNDIDSIQLGHIVAEEAERKQKARADKELAWQKVRLLLLEEEEKASTSIDTTSKSLDSARGGTVEDNIDTVKLLDSMARPGGDEFSYNRSVSSDVDAAPIVDSSLAQSQVSSDTTASTVSGSEVKEVKDLPPQKFARHIDRMGNKISKFLSRGQASDDEGNDMIKSRRYPPHSKHEPFVARKSSVRLALLATLEQLDKPPNSKHEPFVAGKSSVRLALLATLEHVGRTCQRTDLSEASMTRIASHLAAIDQIARDDMFKKNRQQRRRSSSTQWSTSENDSSDEKDFRDAVPQTADDLAFRSAPPVIVETLQARILPTVLNSFKAFDAAKDLGDTITAFKNLVNDCGLSGVQVDEPWHIYYHIKAAVYSKLSFRHKQLFKLLDARFNLNVYKQKPAAQIRVCIIGAGPVGLRAAVETALLGGHVVLLEKREQFSRENMLHLWPWVVQDLVSLGAKVLFPQFCKSNSYFHISTRQLQLILLKVALLVGVTVSPSTDFDSIAPPGLEENGGKPFYTVVTQPQIPMVEFTAVLGASGTNDKLADPAGINRFAFCRKEALGIVCYFPNLGTSDEMKAKEFSWTAQKKHPMLEKLREVGLDLENVVYYRGEMHYLVMTPKRQNLLDLKVVNENRSSSTDLVMDDNVNMSTLHEFVKNIVDFAGIPRKTDFSRVSLFDFSSLTRADKAASILTSHGKKLYVGLIGDSLLEPVWHENIGAYRGFMSALDGVWMVTQIGKKTDEQLLADREAAYQVLQRLSERNREEMQKHVRKYTVDPKSRYTVQFPLV
ncbi:hypothetical protein PHMEG_00018121 [Phytophthora megakarya]|uniref:[F-actin]-monooxygenase MICAL1-3-like Rossman domain-containing protein n=1 Tax=Phytophthora megakarya TaxID=4795 RepID=A0A225VVL6_9STRA|nr:hypothetical protein PHMEG_00018121 [Phytophthora megakarya]